MPGGKLLNRPGPARPGLTLERPHLLGAHSYRQISKGTAAPGGSDSKGGSEGRTGPAHRAQLQPGRPQPGRDRTVLLCSLGPSQEGLPLTTQSAGQLPLTLAGLLGSLPGLMQSQRVSEMLRSLSSFRKIFFILARGWGVFLGCGAPACVHAEGTRPGGPWHGAP